MSSSFPPPSCNTGAQITAPLDNRTLIDWFGFTLFDSLESVFSVLGISQDNFILNDRGGLGYRQCYMNGGIRVYFDGTSSMGVHVEMSGTGCREFESYHDSKDPWFRLFSSLQQGTRDDLTSSRFSITRLDLAIDNIDGQLNLQTIREDIRNGQTRSKFKTGREISGFILGTENQPFTENGTTIYFGSTSSRLQFRIYDKAAECGLTDVEWVRFELQLRDKRAEMAVAHILTHNMQVGTVATSIISNYLNFINIDDSNRSRCSLRSWWAVWLNNTNKLSLTISAKVKHISQVMDHFRKQMAPNLSIINEFLGKKKFITYIQDVLIDGLDRQKIKHRQILAQSTL